MAFFRSVVKSGPPLQGRNYLHSEALPFLNKKVIYLDQFAVSELFKTKTNTRKPGAPNEKFWKDFKNLATVAYLNQQVIFPASNIHSDELIVWHSANELKLAHALLSGETAFENTDDIAEEHELRFAKAYFLKESPPAISFDVDDILDGERNAWISKFHINVNANYSIFADGLRAGKRTAETSLQVLAQSWATKKPTFDEVLKHELASYGTALTEVLFTALAQNKKAIELDNPMKNLDLRTGPINRYAGLKFLLEKLGIPILYSDAEILRFWSWSGNQQQPTHRTFAYLMAALAWRISSDECPDVKAGILNDFQAIATYGPYVDAMFIDKECASLLQQGRLRTEIQLKAKIFSLNSKDDFLQYLRDLGDATSKNVHAYASEIYGLT